MYVIVSLKVFHLLKPNIDFGYQMVIYNSKSMDFCQIR